MKIKMIPGREETLQPNGISRVIEKYLEHGPKFGLEFVEDGEYDLNVVHAGLTGKDCDVAILHGVYFTGDYPATKAEFRVNEYLTQAIRSAKAVTVPTRWVAEILQRDAHIDPFVVPHGIDTNEWEHSFEHESYVLYNKNRDGFDVCDSRQLDHLAELAKSVQFVSTFSRSKPSNVDVIGVQPHWVMKEIVQRAGVYASLTKETFGIGILEALASGVPVLGWRAGGNTDLIEHGVNGYLAEPGNYDDLAAGLFYIINNRKVLSSNAIETARLWTWDNAISKLKVALDYAWAKKNQAPMVDVVIPVHNKVNTIEATIDSVLKQTGPNMVSGIIIVDDQSTDGSAEKIGDLIKNKYNRISSPIILPMQNEKNLGVALTRNRGFDQSFFKYVCFLDGDDQIAPDFISTCVNALEKDPSLYIAYTRLAAVKPDGSMEVSGWPDKWDFDKQIHRHNQVPTCCVMRREVMERTGGFRSRYAPLGAGSEDADLWTRAGALGMKAQLVDERPLFLYRLGGDTSSKDYHEVDWLGWNGYIKTGQHPFLSYATPQNASHKVYQYDQPLVSVIVPVGPGHEKDLTEALDSVEGQTFKKWELVVVLDTDAPVDLSPWPFVQVYRTAHARSGPGAARNLGVKKARGGFVVFLDADDWLAPDAIEKFLVGWSSNQEIIYSDYYGIATVNESDLPQFGSNVVSYLSKKKQATIKHFSAEYDCKRAQDHPFENGQVYHWCIVTCLIPKAWHEEIGGFDEDMSSWEDVDYHWRMARAGKCYTRLKDHLVYYRFDTGNRRQSANPETNGQTAIKLLQYMRDKYERIPKMPCYTCGGSQPSYNNPNNYSSNPLMVQKNAQSDANFELVLYNHPNKGEHAVIGPSTGINYGYRVGGERFLVHKKDIELMPQLFVPAQRTMTDAVAPRPEPVPPPPPEPIVPPVAPKTKKFSISTVPGVTPEIANQLVRLGFGDEDKFFTITEDVLKNIEGISPTRTRIIMAYISARDEIA